MPHNDRSGTLKEFIESQDGGRLLAAADAAFQRVAFVPVADFLKGRLRAMPGIADADDLALGDLLEQMEHLRDAAASLNSFAAEFYRRSGAVKRAVAAIKAFARNPTASNRFDLLEAAAPLDGYRIRMPPRVRRLLRPFIRPYCWRQGLLSYGKLYLAMRDHMKDGVIVT